MSVCVFCAMWVLCAVWVLRAVWELCAVWSFVLSGWFVQCPQVRVFAGEGFFSWMGSS